MAADAWVVYDEFKQTMAAGPVDLDADTFKVVLTSSTNNVTTVSPEVYANLTGELSTAFGYTAGGATLGSVTWTENAGTVTFDFADPSWTASGGSIVARFAVVYDDTASSPADPLVGYSLLDNTPADVTTTTGNTLTLVINSSGMFTLA